jgi:hypothetical protein
MRLSRPFLLRAFAAMLGMTLAGATAQPTPAPAPSPAPIYYGRPPVRMALESRPLGFDPDGNARWLVVVRLFDAQGRPTRIMENDNVDWSAPSGWVQWQPKLAYGNPAAILTTNQAGPLALTARANVPDLGTMTVHTDTRAWHGPRVVARALGPHAIQIGWFPEQRRWARVFRVGNGHRKLLAAIAGPSSSYRDTDIVPGHVYRYVLERAGSPPVRLPPVRALSSPPQTSIADVSGKGMWLYWSNNPLDTLYWKHLHPATVVSQAVHAGLHYVELRTAYGAYWEITPEAKPTIDAIIDGLATHHIVAVGWTVPRDTNFEDLSMSVRTAYYRTQKGTRLYALALDVERGSEFLGDAPQGAIAAIWQYVRDVREAMGPGYVLSPNVEDAYLEHLDNAKYPFAQIARYATVLQPMAYWRMMRRHPTDPARVRVLLTASYQKLLREAGRHIPISIGGQTDAEGPNGYPPAGEITASLQTSKEIGAIGECFFAYDGTQPYQWDAMGAFPWRVP